MKWKYRVVKIADEQYQVEFKGCGWMWAFDSWTTLSTITNLEAAKTFCLQQIHKQRRSKNKEIVAEFFP